jgi:carboxyl-terminal processing protease
MIIKEEKKFYLKIQLSTLYLITITMVFLIALYCYNTLKNNEYNHLTLNNLFTYVENNYKGEITRKEIYQNAMKGVINYLDPYSFSVVKKEKSNLDTVIQNETINLGDSFVGIGITTKSHKDGILISDIFKQSDFFHLANIGDIITEIDNQSYDGNYQNFRKLLQGNNNDIKNIKIYSQKLNEEKELSIKIKNIYKDIINIEMLSNNILHIEIKEFTENLNDNLMIKLEEVLLSYKESISLNGIIINLAENRGGLFNEGLTLAANFVGNNTEVALYSEYKNPEDSTEYFLEGNNIFSDIPMVLIVNKNSASSSEIFAGIFKNFERGTIIGQTTFGKGVGQRLTKFNKDFEFAMTTFEFFIGKDRVKINKVGVTPNILIRESYQENKDLYINTAIKEINKRI